MNSASVGFSERPIPVPMTAMESMLGSFGCHAGSVSSR